MNKVIGAVGPERPALLLSAGLVTVELVGGLLATVGFLTRSISAVLILYLAGAYPLGIGVGEVGIRLACGGAFFVLLLTGPGRYSIDECLTPSQSPEYIVVNRSESSASPANFSGEADSR